MVGTIRTFDQNVRAEIHRRVAATAEAIASSAGASADVELGHGLPVTVNDPDLTAQMIPTIARVAGEGKYSESVPRTGAEDFSYFAQRVPSLFVFLGITPEGTDPTTVADNHSPHFFADEDALIVGVRLIASLATDYMLLNTR